ncbi:hypothetical protein F4778DRAFT_753227 [Xylariomycetidae sp. FL2044]|nr:hypothetical protein F4778DRAFT_753227 [Xylariomycetidae sp. FL2044]
MQFTTTATFIGALLMGTISPSLGSPYFHTYVGTNFQNTNPNDVPVPNWTIECLQRTCNELDQFCTWSFIIDTTIGDATACSFNTTGVPASRARSDGDVCGNFITGTEFSPGGLNLEGQSFDNFTTLQVADLSCKGYIVSVTYLESQLLGDMAIPDVQVQPRKIQPNDLNGVGCVGRV